MDHSRARQQIHKECTHRIFTYHNYRIDLGEGDQLFCGGLVLWFVGPAGVRREKVVFEEGTHFSIFYYRQSPASYSSPMSADKGPAFLKR